MSKLARDGTAEPNSRDQLSRVNGDWQILAKYPVDAQYAESDDLTQQFLKNKPEYDIKQAQSIFCSGQTRAK